MNIFKHSFRENSVINPHIPIFHLTSVLNFVVFVPPLPYTIGGVACVEYFKATMTFISGMHLLKLQQVIILLYDIVHCEPQH